ncbi:hypothetical protein CNYM01_07369 [Colletotrichum nymphaeae SA-01]|uniref:Hydroxyneurosporene synthase n=1 Tax=Colletotrichum nymphaeae SA-01 TaxID=1460502 RepID=A0A135TXW2_9PEZI|nr:hypothetical protein CNYM01_07369 [Colletotrichum nymphaeae SA-01]
MFGRKHIGCMDWMNFVAFSSTLPVLAHSTTPPRTAHAQPSQANHVQYVPPEAFNGSVVPSFISNDFGFDGARMSNFNRSVWDWWYFDVVSPTDNSSIIILFNLAFDIGLLGGSPTTAANADITGTFANGTRFSYSTEAPNGAVIVTAQEGGSSGSWNDAGMTWSSTPDMKTYVVSIETPLINGTVTFESKAPPHYPCGPKEPQANLQIAKNFGWANAVPDSDAVVDITVGGEDVKYTGYGYHDKNWGDKPFVETFTDWYWSHARLGNYSIVWFDFIDDESFNTVSSYASKDGEIITASCKEGAVKVRPVDGPYPPVGDGKFPSAFNIVMDLGKEGILNATVTREVTVMDVPIYKRWTGPAKGSINGGPEMTGVGLWEDVNLLNPLA